MRAMVIDKYGKVKLLLKFAMPLILGNDFSGTIVKVVRRLPNLRLEMKYTAERARAASAPLLNILPSTRKIFL